jgi:hypothetical protein
MLDGRSIRMDNTVLKLLSKALTLVHKVTQDDVNARKVGTEIQATGFMLAVVSRH